MSKGIPYVLRTSDFLKYLNNSRLDKSLKVILFTEKKETNSGKYVENLAMLLVLQIPFTDEANQKQIREIPQSTTTDDTGILRIYRDPKVISETFETIAANCEQYTIEYSNRRSNKDDRFTVEVNNYEAIFKQNLSYLKMEKYLKGADRPLKQEHNKQVVNQDYYSASLNTDTTSNVISLRPTPKLNVDDELNLFPTTENDTFWE